MICYTFEVVMAWQAILRREVKKSELGGDWRQLPILSVLVQISHASFSEARYPRNDWSQWKTSQDHSSTVWGYIKARMYLGHPVYLSVLPLCPPPGRFGRRNSRWEKGDVHEVSASSVTLRRI